MDAQQTSCVWMDELAAAFLHATTTAQGTHIQRLDDPRQFYSFGQWDSLDSMQFARSDPQARAAITKLFALCDGAQPGAFRVVLPIP